MRDDRLTEMRVFRAVAEAGGFLAAARVLGASQPFVSQTIARLEGRLGARLIQRSPRGQRLTPEGARFLEGALRVLAALDGIEADWQQDAGLIDGRLRVSAPIAFGLDRIAPLVPGFLARHPRLSLDLRLTDEPEDLIAGGIDVAVRMGALADSVLVSRRLCALRRVVVASPDFVARHGMPATPDDLARLPLLAWDGSRAHLNRWRFRVGGAEVVVQADGRFRGNQGMSLFQMCLAGLGAFRVAEHLARPQIAAGRLVVLLPGVTEGDDGAIHAVFPPARQVVPRVRALVDTLAEAFRAPDWEGG